MESRRMQHDLLVNSGFHFPFASLLSPQIEDYDAFEDGYVEYVPGRDQVEEPGFRIVFNVACLKEDAVSIRFPDEATLVFKVDEKICGMGTSTFARCCDHQYKLPKGVVRDDLMAIWTEDDYLVIYEKKYQPDFEVIGSGETVDAMKRRMSEIKDCLKVSEKVAKETSNGTADDVLEEIGESSSHKIKQDASKDSEKESVDSEKEPRGKITRGASKDITEEMEEASLKLKRDASKDSEKDSEVSEGKEKPRGKLTRESSIDSGMASQPITRQCSKDEDASLSSMKDEESTTDSYKVKTSEDDATSDSVKSELKTTEDDGTLDSVKSESKASTTNGTDEEAKMEVSDAESKIQQKSIDDEPKMAQKQSDAEAKMEQKPINEPKLVQASSSAEPKMEQKTTEPEGKSAEKDSKFKIRWEVVDGVKRLYPIRLSWRLKPLFEPKLLHSMISQMEAQVQCLKLKVQNNAFLTPNAHALIHAKIRQEVESYKEAIEKKEIYRNKMEKRAEGSGEQKGLQTSEKDSAAMEVDQEA